MNNDLFNQARSLYQAHDYEGALTAFTNCLQDSVVPPAPGELGLLYHQIGNCLVKLKDPKEAIVAYTQATTDAAYEASGAVSYNLGMAYAALHDYDNAVKNFEVAVSDDRYATRYKAYIGMGNALMKVGKSAEAGVAFREAALDEANPDPVKPLLNLGVCFMALNRPLDAVASYESALQFDMTSEMANKLHANLGQAYVASGQMQKAVNAFECAIADKTYFLSDSASVDYQRAVAFLAQGPSEVTQVMAPVADMSGLDRSADGTDIYGDAQVQNQGFSQMGGAMGATQDPYYYDEGPQGNFPGYPEAYADDGEHFFNASDEELEQWSRGLAKKERKRKSTGLKILIFVIVLILLAFAGVVFAYTQGYGYPTQETVARELFANPDDASDLFASDVKDVDSKVTIVASDSDVNILGTERSMSTSAVFVEADIEGGGTMQYKLSLVRNIVGWKISNVELYFPSQN